MFLVKDNDNELIRTQAFQCRLPGEKNTRVYKCQAYSSLENVEQPDLVVVGVKNHALMGVLQKIESAYGTEVPVMSVLNGVEHIKIISSRFPNALFATIGFNAYRVSPIISVAVGGSIALSAARSDNPMLEQVNGILKRKISVTVAADPLDAAHCKLIINLGNALLTIVAFHDHRKRELNVLQKITSEILNEGLTVLKRSGVKEVRISGMPPWILIRLTQWLPQRIVLPIFEKKLQANTINSMAQDVAAGSKQTELEDINGYFIEMARKANVAVPYNEALYHIFKEWLANGAQPMKPSMLLSAINSFSKR
jgi:2-dehydropantoate 2-reductase